MILIRDTWMFIARTEAEAPILWPCDVKSGLTGKDPDAGKDWRQGEKGTTEDEMVGRHHWLNGHEFEQALRVSEGQRNLVCCNPWGHKESEATERLNKNKSERQRDGGGGRWQERETRKKMHKNVKNNSICILRLWVIFIFLFIYFQKEKFCNNHLSLW